MVSVSAGEERNAAISVPTSARGPLRKRTLPELFGIDAGSWFDKAFAGEPLPLLDEALALEAPERLGRVPAFHMIELKENGLVSEVARSLLAEVSAALAEGAIRPLAHRTFAFAELADAFRLMQSSGHIGKLVLLPQAGAGVRLREPPDVALRGDGSLWTWTLREPKPQPLW